MIYFLIGAVCLLIAFVYYIAKSLHRVYQPMRLIRKNRAEKERIKASLQGYQMKLVRALKAYDAKCTVADRLYDPVGEEATTLALKMVNDQITKYIKRNPEALRNEAVYQHSVTYRRCYAAFAQCEKTDAEMRETIEKYRKSRLIGSFANAAADKLERETKKRQKPIFGFGLMRLPLLENGDVDLEQSMRMADCMIQNGFTYFDTAYFYLNGRSESVAKQILCDRYSRENFRLADKMPVSHLKVKADVERIFALQLERTGAGYFDYYLLHALNGNNYEKQVKEFDVFAFAAEQKEKGTVRRVGFSFHDKPEVLDKILTEHPEVDFVQLQINYYDWETNNVASRRCYEVARAHGKPIVIMEPIKGGTLANMPKELRDTIPDLLENDTPATLALRFAATREGVMMVLSGMSGIEQAQENVQRMRHIEPLDAQDCERLLKIGKAMRKIPRHPCTRCRYCEEACPRHLPISEMIAAINRRLLGSEETVPMQGQCVGCGACEAVCPQKLKIRKIIGPSKKK